MSSIIKRGSDENTPISRGLFVLFRALDLRIQYSILSRSLGAPLIAALGGTPIPESGPPFFLLGTNIGLSPQRAILFGMAAGSFIRQSHWVTAISQEPMTTPAAVFIAAWNTTANAANTLLFTNAATSVLNYNYNGNDETELSLPTVVGIGMYVVGMLLEWGSETQRLRFKKDPSNKGRVYTGGLFGLARHINYGGYVLWRAGFATAAAGWVWGAVNGLIFATDFAIRAIPELDGYCEGKYNEAWLRYRRAVPYKLFPFIY